MTHSTASLVGRSSVLPLSAVLQSLALAGASGRLRIAFPGPRRAPAELLLDRGRLAGPLEGSLRVLQRAHRAREVVFALDAEEIASRESHGVEGALLELARRLDEAAAA